MRWGPALLAVCVLGACHGGGSHEPNAKQVLGRIKPFVAPPSTPTTRPPATTTSTTVEPRDATAIAKALGCAKVQKAEGGGLELSGLPDPEQEVSCEISGVDLDVSVWRSHADLATYEGASGTAIICGLLHVLDVHGPQYIVEGDDFVVSAQTSETSENNYTSTGTRAQADALGRALGLPVTTIHC